MCAMWSLDHGKDDNDCPAKVKVVNWEKPRSKRPRNPINFDNYLLVTRERKVCNHKRCHRSCMRPHLGWNSLVCEI